MASIIDHVKRCKEERRLFAESVKLGKPKSPETPEEASRMEKFREGMVPLVLYPFEHGGYDSDGEEEEGHKSLLEIKTLCTERIEALGITVLDLVVDGNVDEDDDEADALLYTCALGDYRFTVGFSYDCDCRPGILHMDNIKKDGEMVCKGYCCDLLLQNTGPVVRDAYISLMHHSSIEEFFFAYNRRFEEIYTSLDERGYNVRLVRPDFGSPNHQDIILVNDHHFVYTIELIYKHRPLTIFLHTHYDRTELYVCRTIVRCPVTTTIIRVDNVNSLIFLTESFQRYPYTLDYTDDTKVEDVIGLIEDLDLKISGQHGYCEDGVYYTEKDVKERLTQHGVEVNCKTVRTGFDVTIVVTPDYHNRCVGIAGIPSELNYPVDRYLIRFTYNRRKDKLCSYTVTGEYYNLNAHARAYCRTGEFIRRDVITTELNGGYSGTFTESIKKIAGLVKSILAV